MHPPVAIVLARGLGRRMREESAHSAPRLSEDQRRVADAGQKTLMPMSTDGRLGRPFLDYVLSGLADVGIEDVALVVGPGHDALRAHYDGDRAPERLNISFVVQREALGTADAVLAAESFVAGRAFLSLNADNLYPDACLRALIGLDGPGLPGFERDELIRSSGIPASRVGSFALLDVSPEGVLRGIVEKPGETVMAAAGNHALVSMNVWRFDERILGACRDVPRSARGEFELPEAVRLAIHRGVRFAVLPAMGPVLDLSRREDIPAVAARLSHREIRL